MLKGYTYRLHPTPAQAEFLIKTIGCARFIYNKLLEDRIAIRDEAKAGIVTRRPIEVSQFDADLIIGPFARAV